MKQAIIWFCLLSLMCIGTVWKAAHADWRPADTHWEMGYVAIAVADAFTTADIRNHPDIEEVAPGTRQVLGRNPEPVPTAAFFAAEMGLHYLVSKALPPTARRIWQVTTVSVQGAVVANNIRIGLRFGF